MIVADVDVPPVADGPNEVIPLVHPPAKTVQIRLRLGDELAGERMTLILRRRLDPRETQHRRRQVDEADQPIGRSRPPGSRCGRRCANFSGMRTISGTCSPEL